MKLRYRLLTTSCIFASLAAPVFTQESAGWLTTDPIYDKNCAKCHGKTADGRHFGGPSLARTSLSVDEVRAMIADGKGRMPKFSGKLTDDEIATLAAEINAFSVKQARK